MMAKAMQERCMPMRMITMVGILQGTDDSPEHRAGVNLALSRLPNQCEDDWSSVVQTNWVDRSGNNHH
jgi:hypothetical protein